MSAIDAVEQDKQKPVVVIEIPYSPNHWQKELHLNDRRKKIINIHRQAGKTTWSCAELLRRALKKQGLYWYVAPTYQAAYDIAWRKLVELIPRQAIRRKHETKMSIFLKNGSLIQLKGCEEPDKLRGRTIDGLVIDEFASITKQKELWEEVLEPTLLRTKGWVVFLSTPKGKNYFWLLYEEAKSNPEWFHKTLTVEDTGILSKDEILNLRNSKDRNAFLQEYMCSFLEDEGLVFRGIDRVVADTLSGPLPGRRYQIGVDLARKTDYTVITVVDKTTLRTVHLDRFNQIDWPLQKARIEALYRKYSADKLVMDSTGVGDPIIQDLQREGLYIEEYQYTNLSKKKLIDNLSVLIEKQKIKIPEHPELIKELKIFGFERTDAGNTRYEAPHGFHDDCVNSLALAYWGLTEPQRQINPFTNLTGGQGMTAYEYDL